MNDAVHGKQTENAVFDVIVVGGGSAGAVMANRLSADGKRNVLLLEAGQSYEPHAYPAIIAQSDILGANGDPQHEWGYKSEAGYVGHPIAAIRGKVLGGSSGVNGAVALRARPEDFQRWNLPGWSYQDMLPHFKNLENRSGGSDELHGRSGPLPVRQLERADITPMQRAFLDATLANGHREIADFDAADANGAGPYPMNIVDGVRVNTGMAYLTDAVRSRENLFIHGDSMVDKVLFDGKRAIGVQMANGARLYAGEVVLSAGSYGSAAILLRSGVGPQAHLRELEIPLVADLPVGLNLIDHPFYYNAYAAKPEAIGAQTPVIGAKLWTHSSSAVQGELDVHITATHLFPHEQSPTKVGFVLAVALTRPLSRGRLSLNSRDPLAAPKIDLNFLAEPEDRARLLEAVKLSRRIGQTAPLAAMVSSELNPGPDAQSDEAILASIKATLDTYHHPTSTAPMGHAGAPEAVVDFEGKVHGLTGLRVVDASIFPDVPSVATNVTTIAAAERIASRFA
ncbi:GMC family oxidoreductase [Massilia sp. BJB1822]|uniref:GMC family oxidoreductase n=1 Tax=Massilia sp. BJB1822 TaxID=2744470 RepID=UPI0015942BAB|nr:GMC oxidoreductase [Massilia sp. BJB1822]NVE01467.1 GMC family oxidoreductase N-terminal domain-containing protein [Massilia sp. BJB1822]